MSREVGGRENQNHAANRAVSPPHSVMSAGGELLLSGIDVGLAIGQEHYDADSRSSRRRYFEIKHDFDLKMSRLDRRCFQWNKFVSTSRRFGLPSDSDGVVLDRMASHSVLLVEGPV